MNKNDRKVLKEIENDLQKIYWDICEGKTNGAGEVQAIAFRVAQLRGYEGD